MRARIFGIVFAALFGAFQAAVAGPIEDGYPHALTTIESVEQPCASPEVHKPQINGFLHWLAALVGFANLASGYAVPSSLEIDSEANSINAIADDTLRFSHLPRHE